MMLKNEEYQDLEDTLQYILAKKKECDFILSNENNFKSNDLPVLSSKDFCMKYKLI